MLNLIDNFLLCWAFYDGCQMSLLVEKWHRKFLQRQCFKARKQICNLGAGQLAFQGAQPGVTQHETQLSVKSRKDAKARQVTISRGATGR